MRSCTSRPTELSTSAVTMAVSRPKQRLRPRATLYSPPPSQTWKLRAVWIRPSPGSRRSITSPRLTRSKRQPALGFTLRAIGGEPYRLPAAAVNAAARDRVRDSADEHRVAVAVEAVAERERLAVRIEDALAAGESRDEEQQRRAR